FEPQAWLHNSPRLAPLLSIRLSESRTAAAVYMNKTKLAVQHLIRPLYSRIRHSGSHNACPRSYSRMQWLDRGAETHPEPSGLRYREADRMLRLLLGKSSHASYSGRSCN